MGLKILTYIPTIDISTFDFELLVEMKKQTNSENKTMREELYECEQ